jgi:hypothetical protein
MNVSTGRDAAIVRRLKAGETLQAIGDDYGLTRERVRQIAGKNGLEPRMPQIMARRVERDAEVMRCLEAGNTSQEVADDLGIGLIYVYTIAHRNGLWLAPIREAATKKQADQLRHLVEKQHRSILGAARELGINRGTAFYWAKKFKIKSPHGRWPQNKARRRRLGL